MRRYIGYVKTWSPGFVFGHDQTVMTPLSILEPTLPVHQGNTGEAAYEDKGSCFGHYYYDKEL